jgi:hypothetical protein
MDDLTEFHQRSVIRQAERPRRWRSGAGSRATPEVTVSRVTFRDAD